MPESIYIERGVSALKSDAVLHLGNFFGAIRGSLDAQEMYARNNFLFVANRHYLVNFDANVDVENREFELVRDFLAIGFNPKRTVIYRQSDIRELFSLMWLLSCSTSFTELYERFSHSTDPTVGQVLYPQLMAADILGLRATRVYVGLDETAHITYCHEVANSINERARSTLLPRPIRAGSPETSLVPGVNGQPMSKSTDNIIPVFAPEKMLDRLFRKLPVAKVKKREAIDPETDVAFQLVRLMGSTEQVEDIRKKYMNAEIGEDDARSFAREEFFRYFSNIRKRRAAQQIPDQEIQELFFEGQQRVRREMRNTLVILEDYLYNRPGAKHFKPRLS